MYSVLYHEIWSELFYRRVQCCTMSYDLSCLTDMFSAVPWDMIWAVLQTCSVLYHDLWSELSYRPVRCCTRSYDLSCLTDPFTAVPWVMIWAILQLCSLLYQELWSELSCRCVQCCTMSYDLSYLTVVFSAVPGSSVSFRFGSSTHRICWPTSQSTLVHSACILALWLPFRSTASCDLAHVHHTFLTNSLEHRWSYSYCTVYCCLVPVKWCVEDFFLLMFSYCQTLRTAVSEVKPATIPCFVLAFIFLST
jgi:hypothetical protein